MPKIFRPHPAADLLRGGRQSWRWLRFWMPAEGETLRMGRIVAIAATVGLLAGLLAICFFSAIDYVRIFTLETLMQSELPTANGEVTLAHFIHLDLPRWVLRVGQVLLPAAGALLACLIARKFAPSAGGHGTDTVIAAYHRSDVDIPMAVAPVRIAASSLVIGTGGSAGAEGPITQIGATCGAFVGRILHLSLYERRVLLAAGMAAGIGAIFRAPMAGALFAAEILYRGFDLEGDVLIPSMVASTIAYMTYACVFGWDPVFTTTGETFADPTALFGTPAKFLLYAALAFLIAAVVRFNILFFRQTVIVFRRFDLPPWAKPAIGGLLVGLIGLAFPQILSTGYGHIQQTLLGDVSGFGRHFILILFLLGALKAVSTSFTVGSGGAGGMLGPALFSGAMYGAGCGALFGMLFPSLNVSVANCAMLGMAGYLTAAVRTPLAAIIMVSEFTGNHNLLLPSMWVCGLSFLLTPGWTLYKSQLRDRDSSPAHLRRHVGLRHDVAIRVKRRPTKKKRK